MEFWEAQEYWSRYPILSPGDLPDPGIKPGSPAMQVDSLPAELPGKPIHAHTFSKLKVHSSLRSYGFSVLDLNHHTHMALI